jgi:hypothetical protein
MSQSNPQSAVGKSVQNQVGLASQIEQWIHQTIARKGLSVQYRLRGNTLHLLCRQATCPDQTQTLLWLIPILQKTRFNRLLPPNAPPLYQIWLYGCQTGDKRPRWTKTLYLNQLDQQLEQLRQEVPAMSNQAAGTGILQEASATQTGVAEVASGTPVGAPAGALTSEANAPTAPARKTNSARSTDLALALSNASMAKQGEEMAIACYLSETLSDLGVAVRVSAKVIPYSPPTTVQAAGQGISQVTNQNTNQAQPQVHPQASPTAPADLFSPEAPHQLDLLTTRRLWVACEAVYSPAPALVSDPVTQKLRALEIEGFHDAVILFQVTGEAEPDWALRVDLTPPSEMLREWARWGDVEAIHRLLNQDIAALGLEITTATQNATTLHLCCGSLTQAPGSVIEYHKRAKADIALLLEAIAPQGLHAATLYGHVPEQEAPLWVEWLDLPAGQHPALAESAIDLANQGDWAAIAFLLHRLLNPNLDHYLQTGGIRLQLLPKQDLLHVMSEASHCPDRKQIVPVLLRFLRQLNLPQIAGVRIYGRRAGQKKPLWSYGLDFTSRSRLVPEVTPEFAATDAYVEELLPQPGQKVIRPDLTPSDLHSAWKEWQQAVLQTLQQFLLRSQLFTVAESLADRQTSPLPALPDSVTGRNSDQASSQANRRKLHVLSSETGPTYELKTGLVWGAVGLILMVQANWFLGKLAQYQAAQTRASQTARSQIAPASSDLASAAVPPAGSANPQLKPATPDAAETVFNTNSFTRQSDSATGASPSGATRPNQTAADRKVAQTLPYTPRSQTDTLLTAEILAEKSPLPSFNSQQMDEKLQLYYRYVETFGPPDVLIVGSSRALRGVDPVALQLALNDVGHANAKVFNFGINGATAQVVNLLVQHLLPREQLPRMIIWADGARAFNSGTVDVTYNGIVASAAYQQLLAGTLPLPHSSATAPPPVANPTSLNRSLSASYQAIDRWLSQQMAALTGRESDRDQLKRTVQTGMTALLPASSQPLTASAGDQAVQQILRSDQTLPDETGFLSLPVQFNPATYYQKYARVLGAYDSDYENFRITGSQESALQSLLKFTETSQIPVVFVNLPLTEDYLDPVRLEYEQTFRDYLVKMSLNHPGFVFRDLSEQWTTQYRYFSDPSHLNRYGAHAVSVWLAQDAKIPWEESERTAVSPSNRAANSAPEGEG